MKKNIFAVFLLVAGTFLYSTDVKIIKGKQKINYYGFPLFYAYGFNYRYNDFELFMPYAGFEFDANPNPQLKSVAGADVLFKNYFCSISGFYELWNPEIKSFSENTQYGGKLELGLLGPDSKIILGSTIEQKQWENDSNNQSYLTLQEFFKLNLMLLNLGYIESTANTQLSVFILPQNNFTCFNVNVDIPFTVEYGWSETCFLYSGFYSSKLYSESDEQKFKISKKYNEITGRINFVQSSVSYNNIHLLEIEERIYPAKIFNCPLNLFISVFGNVGIGMTEESSLDVLWEAGGGLGFNLFGTVPFTFQAGINSNKSFIMYLGVVSKISHNP